VENNYTVEPYMAKDGSYASQCPVCEMVVRCMLRVNIERALCGHMNAYHKIEEPTWH
jgi:hypothetical protein